MARRLAAPRGHMLVLWVLALVGAALASDRDVLHSIYDKCGGPRWTDQSWKVDDPSSDWCFWGGIGCHSFANVSRVTKVNVTGFGLSCPAIPDDFGRLPLLTELILSNNVVRELPVLTSLVNLAFLGCNSCHLQGVVDGRFMQWNATMRYLELSDNDLHGALPSEIFSPKLEALDVSGNRLAGELPHMSGSPELTFFSAHSNRLTGPLPASLFDLANLSDLFLNSNQLGDGVYGLDAAVGRLSRLRMLMLFGNRLAGRIPAALINCTRLERMYLYTNAFDGEIPAEVLHMQSLRKVYLNRNRLTGPLPVYAPSSPEQGRALIELVASENALTGAIPPSYGNFPSLVDLHLYNNNLSGVLPPELANLGERMESFVAENQTPGFTGDFPAEYARFTNLRHLRLSSAFAANASVTFGPWMCNLTRLESLALANVSLRVDGTVVGCTNGSLPSLRTIDLANNGLGSSALPFIRDTLFPPTLYFMDLSGNALGTIDGLFGADTDYANWHLETLLLADTRLCEAYDSMRAVFDRLAVIVPAGSLRFVDVSGNGCVADLNSATTWDDFPIFDTLSELDLSENVVTGDPSEYLPAYFPNLRTFVLRKTNASGLLPTANIMPALRTVDVSGSSDIVGFRSGLLATAPDTDFLFVKGPADPTPSLSCPRSVVTLPTAVRANVEPTFFEYTLCTCLNNFFGRPRADGTGCRACLAGASCQGDGTLSILGSWPDDANSPSSLTTCPSTARGDLHCLSYEYDPDVGGSVTCANGYADRMCEACAADHFRLGSNKCTRCTTAGIVLGLLWTVAVHLAPILLIVLTASFRQGISRVLFGHLNLMLVLSSLASSHTGASSTSVLSTLIDSVTTLHVVPGVACLAPSLQHPQQQAVMAMAIVVYVPLVSVLVWLVPRSRARAKTVFAFLWLTYSFAVVRTVLHVVNCTQYGVGDSQPDVAFLSTAQWVRCERGSALGTVALVFVACYIFATLAAVTVAGCLWDAETVATRGWQFITAPYRPRLHFWEVIVTARRLSLAFVEGIAAYQSALQPVGIFVLLFVSLLLHLIAQPYISPLVNGLETISLATLLLSYFIVVVLALPSVSGGTAIALYTTVVAANLLIVAVFVACAVREKWALVRAWHSKTAHVQQQEDHSEGSLLKEALLE